MKSPMEWMKKFGWSSLVMDIESQIVQIQQDARDAGLEEAAKLCDKRSLVSTAIDIRDLKSKPEPPHKRCPACKVGEGHLVTMDTGNYIVCSKPGCSFRTVEYNTAIVAWDGWQTRAEWPHENCRK